MFADANLITRDGTTLVSRMWRPQGDGPWPTLLMRQPYGRAIASTVTLPHPQWWCRHGFLVVVQDVRGQGDSQGSFTGFSQEASDTADTLNWLRELPEVNGRIGLYGFSYQGLTQLLAPEDSPPPDCMAPAMCGLDERNHWSCEGEAHWWHLGLGWGLQLAALQARRRGDQSHWEEIRRSLEDGSYLRDGLRLLEQHDPHGMAVRWFHQPANDASAWIQHSVSERWLQTPMLLLGGWWDPHLRGLLDLAKRSRAVGGQPDLHIGPATHLQWWPQSSQLLLNFFQHHLQDQPSTTAADGAAIAGVHLWDQTRECWDASQAPHPANQLTADSPCWSISSAGLACLDPNEGCLIDGNLTSERCNDRGKVVIVHDPWRPVPAVGGHLSPTAGPVDRASVDQRSDVALFTGAPLTQSLQLSGRPMLQIVGFADQPGFDLCVALSRLPAGTKCVQQLSTGVLRSLGQSALHPRPLTLELQALHATLNPGDRLRLSIAGAAWPAIAINPGHPDAPCGAPNADCRVISIELHLDTAQLQMLPMLLPQTGGTPAD